MYSKVVMTAAVAAVATACDSRPNFVGPATPSADDPLLAIADGAHHSGQEHFYFLPPLVAQPVTSGDFDPSLLPTLTVEICEVVASACAGPPVVHFAGNGGMGSERIRLSEDDEHYIVNWHTRKAGLSDGSYRIQVRSNEHLLGYADVLLVAKGPKPEVNPRDYVVVRNGRTLPIKFRVEIVPPAIAFASDRHGSLDLFTIGPDGSGLTRLTDDPGTEWEPTWSPDRTEIAFASDQTGVFRIWAMNADGTGSPRQITAGGVGDDRNPQWSPDGTRIVFYSRRTGDLEIYTVQSDGSSGAAPTRLTTSAGVDYDPSWSPDGTQIAFASSRASGNQDIWVINADGSGTPQRLTTHPAIDYSVDWGPTGTIAFATERFGGVEDIMIMDADGSNQLRLTSHPTEDFDMSWSPEGDQLAFSSLRSGTYEVYVLTLATNGIAVITSGPGFDYLPAWHR